MQSDSPRQLGTPSLFGFAISATGGPLALAMLYLSQNAHIPGALLVHATLGGILLFLAPLLVWVRYARTIASAGGLTAFVRAATNQRIARIHGVLWSVSYLSYLPYTVTYIFFYLYSAILPTSTTVLNLTEVGLPCCSTVQ